MRTLPCAAMALAIAAAAVHATPAEYAETMFKLATERGCMACHSILPLSKRADGLPPPSHRLGATSPSSTGMTPARRSGSHAPS